MLMLTPALQTLTLYYASPYPPPYAYRFTLVLRWQPEGLAVRYDQAYPDREELSEEDILEEGFTLDDDFHWQGSLPAVWRETLEATLARTSELRNSPPEAYAPLLMLSVQYASLPQQEGYPGNTAEWEYLLQELVQAVYEASRQEHPLEIRYRDAAQLIRVRASFLHRRLTVDTDPPSAGSQPRDWAALAPLLRAVYLPHYDPEGGLTENPSSSGRYIDPGDGRWYALGQQVTNPGNKDVLNALINNIRSLL